MTNARRAPDWAGITDVFRALVPTLDSGEALRIRQGVELEAGRVQALASGPSEGASASLVLLAPVPPQGWAGSESGTWHENPQNWQAVSMTVAPGTGRVETMQLSELRSTRIGEISADLSRRVAGIREQEAVRLWNQMNRDRKRPYPRSSNTNEKPLFTVRAADMSGQGSLETMALDMQQHGVLLGSVEAAVARGVRLAEASVIRAAMAEMAPDGAGVLRACADGPVTIESYPMGNGEADGCVINAGTRSELASDVEILVTPGEFVTLGQPIARSSDPERKQDFAVTHARAILDALRDYATDFAAARTDAAFETFRSHLDPAALRMSGTLRGLSGDLYNHFNADGDAAARRNRMQAAHVLPALRTLVHEDEPVVEAIDAGRPFQQAMREVYGLSPSAVRHLRETRIEDIGIDDSSSLRVMVRGLNAIRPDHYPGRSKEVPAHRQWEAFMATWGFLESACSEMGISAEPVMAIERPLWLQGKKCEPLDITELRDSVKSFEKHVLTPIALDVLAENPAFDVSDWRASSKISDALGNRAWHGAREVLQETLLKGRSLARIGEMAERWQAEGSHIGRALAGAGEREELTWPPLTGSYASPDGSLVLSPLTSDTALREESDRMANCVGRGLYLPKCLYENVHILTVRGRDGSPISTVEVEARFREPDGTGALPPPDLSVVQHKGRKNEAAPPDAVRLVEAWVEDVRQGRVKVDGEDLQAELAARQQARGERAVVDLVGYDPSDRGVREAMFKAYAFMLPRGERGMDLDAWVEHKGLHGMMRDNLRIFDAKRRERDAEFANQRKERAQGREAA